MQKSHLKAINAFLFMPHHLVITLVYFPLPLALLFTLATGVAGWAWMNQRLNGAKIPELWISHFILDIIVIGGALISFNLI
jgi:TRAP-type C4-dicarboxylate transport system permease small subunit